MSVRIVGLLNAVLDEGALGGAERTALEIWALWSQRADLTVITTTEGVAPVRAASSRIDVIGLVTPRTKGRREWIAQTLRSCARVMRLRCDLMMTSSLYFFDMIPAAFARITGRTKRLAVRIPHIILDPKERAGGYLKNVVAQIEQQSMLALATRTADVFLVDNDDIVAILVGRGIPRERIAYARVGLRRYEPESIEIAPFDALYVGRRSETKGLDTLAAAWESVEREFPSARLVLAGYDEVGYDTRSRFGASIARGSVVLVDRPSNGQIVTLLRRARFFVMPSREEGYGRVILEALAEGTPCVTFGIPAFRYAFPHGRIEAAGNDAQALAAAMRVALRDPALLHDVAEQARRLHVLSWEEVADELWGICVGPMP